MYWAGQRMAYKPLPGAVTPTSPNILEALPQRFKNSSQIPEFNRRKEHSPHQSSGLGVSLGYNIPVKK
jgi:hypothetical protein